MGSASDGMTVAERYARAASSSDLRMIEHRPGDADVIAAAGMARESLATMLHRLRAEVDQAAGEMKLYLVEARRLSGLQKLHLALADAEALKQHAGPTRADFHREQAEAAGQQAEHEERQGRAFLLVRLKHLAAARDALGRHACREATRRRFMRSDAEVCAIVGRALDVWLIPGCPKCDGRGFKGGYDSPQVLCPIRNGCGGSGRRRLDDMDTEARAFAQWLLADIERRLSNADCRLAQCLRG